MNQKAILFAVSDTFFRSSFWTLKPEDYTDYDIWVINAATLYLKHHNIRMDGFISADTGYLTKLNPYLNNYFPPEKILFTINGEYFWEDKFSCKFTVVRNIIRKEFAKIGIEVPAVNSGYHALAYFLGSKIYNEIHLVGLNLIGASSGFNQDKHYFQNYQSQDYKILQSKISNYERFAANIKKLYEQQSDVILYKTHQNSALYYLPESTILSTGDIDVIDKNIPSIEEILK